MARAVDDAGTDRKSIEAALAAARRDIERLQQLYDECLRQRTAHLETEIARRITTQARLHQAQKMEAVARFSGGLAHDFNNVLQVIMGNLEIVNIALSRSADHERIGDKRVMIERATMTAQQAAQNAKDLLQRLLAFSRRGSLAPTLHDIHSTLGQMTPALQRVLGASIRVETALAEGDCPVYADRRLLERALLNLVVNARDAMPDGGTLKLDAAYVDLPPDDATGLARGRYVRITVRDNGCGIAPEHLEQVFEPFFTTKGGGKGRGLGLAMVYGFVRQSGGDLRIQSEVGAGTTVEIYLPCAAPSVLETGKQ